ncbi:GNAT family N-acetyltransferase [Halostella litorea]|uniref:GNAT family N-acetyltransferase n=1 Tax=Halostella litorea TaxID=2528831 RepID=UPI00109302A2|nr:GNAT family N-acetyltransferase [Halostella litorea]
MAEVPEPGGSAPFPETIRTDRLRIERLCHDAVDLQEYYRICSADDDIDEVTEFLSWEPHDSIRETKAFVDMVERQWENGESAAYLLRPREPEPGAGDIAGGTGMTVDWERGTGTLGIWLRKRFWGRGYAGERAAAFVELAFERLGLDRVAVEHRVGNERSRRAVEKYVDRFGGSYDGRQRNWAVKADEVREQHRYTISREQYRRSRDRRREVTA